MLPLGHLGWLGTAGTSRGAGAPVSLACLIATNAYSRSLSSSLFPVENED